MITALFFFGSRIPDYSLSEIQRLTNLFVCFCLLKILWVFPSYFDA
ncbi:unnamed protein product [Acanthoscelides obtectus]|uniref:Uncharacterized protein n=1 Tax=Acanthoscelides obtectus TaxID=200917 RepID=A0A9P0JRF2_ACAOB|nr:unnamed protein product [Acanthoscelides obtectus]CAK1671259.1 hypothetical protein AOBTE_LOCUS28194 [Acanthoscelides obtectus]